MKKPRSVQFKFLEDLKSLTEPTEPRMSIVQTLQIPAQEQEKLKKRVVKRRAMPALLPLYVTASALALCTCLLLLIILHH